MTATCSLELGLGLCLSPTTSIQAANILIQCLGQEWAGRDGAVRTIRLFILSMAFMKNHGPDIVQIFKRGEIYIAYEEIHQKRKVDGTFQTILFIYTLFHCFTAMAGVMPGQWQRSLELLFALGHLPLKKCLVSLTSTM